MSPRIIGLALLAAAPAHAFPPYRSTDAGAADPWLLEPRLGLIRAAREGSEVEVTTPLARLNLGLPHDFELKSELEYAPSKGRLGDAGIGAKWIPFPGKLAFGTELLLLLPVSEEGGLGVEAQALASYRPTPLRLHVNAGGFADGRTDPSENGWRASALAELELGAARPGLELFAKQLSGDDLQMLAGLGTIADLGPFDLRLGIHAGLTDASPDLVASTWISGDLPLGGSD
jgi:hypothetical protein